MLNTLLSMLVQKVKDEPAVVAGLVAGGLVALAGSFGIILDKVELIPILTPVISGIATRFFVSPANKPST